MTFVPLPEHSVRNPISFCFEGDTMKLHLPCDTRNRGVCDVTFSGPTWPPAVKFDLFTQDS